MYFNLRLVQSLLITSFVFTCADIIEPTKTDMIKYLLEETGYDGNFPPTTENVTYVSVQLHITDLDSESDKNMEIELTLYLRMNWTDERLDFSRNKTSYDTIHLGNDIASRPWKPDLYFIQQRKSELQGLFTKNQLIYIHKNGSVFYSGRFNIKTQCYMKFSKFPYDTQNCPIEIQSYAFTTDYLHLQWIGDDPVVIDSKIHSLNSGKPRLDQHIENRITTFGEFSTLITEINFKRPKGSYGITVIAPPIIVVIIALMSFFSNNDVKSRIAIPTGGLTQLFVQWAGIYNMLSLDSTPDYLDIWMLGNIICVGAILVINIILCHYKYIQCDNGTPIRKLCRCCGNDGNENDQRSEMLSMVPRRANYVSMDRQLNQDEHGGRQSVQGQTDETQPANPSTTGNNKYIKCPNFAAFIVTAISYAIFVGCHIDAW